MTLTEATRKYIVKGARIRKEARGSIGFPKGAFEEGREPSEVWRVYLDVQEGLLPQESILTYFLSEEEAKAYTKKHPIGSIFTYSFTSEFIEKMDFEKWVDLGWFPIKAGGPNSFTVFDTLKSSGITDEAGINTSQHIIDALGTERVKALIEIYGENWQVVARYQYCVNALPHSSPAYIAAAHDFCYFILEDDFKAGYLLRDLEVLLNGVEVTAVQAIEMRQKAGRSGSRKSSQAREKRRSMLFERMVELASRNADIAQLLGAEGVARLALQQCIEEDAIAWKQGPGQVSEYLGEIRRGEAGTELQQRYQQIFGAEPPKRFRGMR